MARARVALLTCAVASAAFAANLGGRAELGGAVPLSEPQSTVFGAGFSGGAVFSLEVLPALDVEALASYVVLSSALPGDSTPGTMATLGVGARLKRPMMGAQVVPFLELPLKVAVTGNLRLALEPAGGLLLRLSTDSPVWFGPVVRFSQIFKLGEVPNLDTFNASLLTFGLAVEFFPTPKDAEADADSDGVPDKDDKCPQVAAGPDGASGCPAEKRVASVTDADDDGVPDKDDACPDAAGTAAAKGCPDSDSDGVPDNRDACPKRPGRTEENGCPVYKEVIVTATKIEIRQKIYFAFGTTTILPKSEPLLDQVVQALNDRDTICLRIEGHTDNKGSEEKNLSLSQGRATAVRDYLSAHGVAGERLTAKGYGSKLPLDDNSTPDGREVNRRVEFVIVPCGEQPK